jgi:hypothetical protein
MKGTQYQGKKIKEDNLGKGGKKADQHFQIAMTIG